MSTPLRLLCTDTSSDSAKRLADKLSEALDYKVFRSGKVLPNRQHIRYGDQRDKLTQYNYFRKNKLNFPWFTESKDEAIEFMERNNIPIVCRVLLKGQEGRGIVIADNADEMVDAPVYVSYNEKTTEYRINFFKGRLVNIREKKRKREFDAPDKHEPRIRNIANGYVFCLVDAKNVDAAIINTAYVASKVTDSDVVGVDVAYNKKTGNHFLLEVNSAPALEGVTVDDYVKEIIKRMI